MSSNDQHLTELLHAWSQGQEDALGELVQIVYDDLHSLARRYMSQERPGHTLQATALVNEAYLRLLSTANLSWQDRSHFFAVCGRLMRRILVDFARSKQTIKRGNDLARFELDEAQLIAGGQGTDLVAIDDALKSLAAVDERKCQVVELRFFAGLSAKETAEVLKVSEETVLRDWKLAKSWLRRELNKEHSLGS
jgi:RNA polymerase sigma factor (TIGR02999 family)